MIINAKEMSDDRKKRLLYSFYDYEEEDLYEEDIDDIVQDKIDEFMDDHDEEYEELEAWEDEDSDLYDLFSEYNDAHDSSLMHPNETDDEFFEHEDY